MSATVVYKKFVNSKNQNIEKLHDYSISFTIKLLAYKSFAELCKELMEEEVNTQIFNNVNQELFKITDSLFD
jgi:hypothetical protein